MFTLEKWDTGYKVVLNQSALSFDNKKIVTSTPIKNSKLAKKKFKKNIGSLSTTCLSFDQNSMETNAIDYNTQKKKAYCQRNRRYKHGKTFKNKPPSFGHTQEYPFMQPHFSLPCTPQKPREISNWPTNNRQFSEYDPTSLQTSEFRSNWYNTTPNMTSHHDYYTGNDQNFINHQGYQPQGYNAQVWQPSRFNWNTHHYSSTNQATSYSNQQNPWERREAIAQYNPYSNAYQSVYQRRNGNQGFGF